MCVAAGSKEVPESRDTSEHQIQGVALYGALFFFSKKLAVSVALNGAGCAGSVALLHHLVPERTPLQKPSKTKSVDERSLGQFVALYGACRSI